MPIPVIGLGPGGHARVLIEAIRLEGTYQIVGMLDRDRSQVGKDILGVPILGSDELLVSLSADVRHFFIGLGSVGNMEPRRRLYERAIAAGLHPIKVVHPAAVVSAAAVLGEGIAVLAGAVINACARIGINGIVNTGSIVEHDCIVGDHVHIATGARLCGTVTIGNETHVGAGSTILQGISVGHNTIIGAGAVVIRDVPPGSTVVGIPARPIGSTAQDLR